MPLPKPPKLFRINKESTPPPAAPEEARVWSPSQPATNDFVAEPETTPQAGQTVPETVTPAAEAATFVPEPPEPASEIIQPVPAATPETADTTVSAEPVSQQSFTPVETPTQTQVSQPSAPVEEDFSRYARPSVETPAVSEEPVPETPEQPTEATEAVPETATGPEPEAALEPEAENEPESKVESRPFDIEHPETTVENITREFNGEYLETESEQAINYTFDPKQKVIRVPSLNSIPFSDIWYTAEKIAYIRDTATKFALVPFLSDDLDEFYKALEQGYTGQSSYAIRFAGESYRVERIITLTGVQYNCRKMPGSIPDIHDLGLPAHVVDYLLTLSCESGLILFGGPTGMGKTTSASALMKKFLEMDGGFMYTIEDPPEMPLDGLYNAQKGGLGLCKQCPVDNERWGDGIKSALRSRPRYILVGEIRTPETASQVLRAATSGHLVLSTIHASTVEDALESIIKYASGAGLTEALAADLLARGILAVVHQKLEGVEKLHPVLTVAFADPHLTGGDQMRSLIRSNNINLQTLIESQASRLMQGRPLFTAGKPKEDQGI